MKTLFTILLAAFAMTAFAATDAVTKQDKNDVPTKSEKASKAKAEVPKAKASEPVKVEAPKAEAPKAKASEPVKK